MSLPSSLYPASPDPVPLEITQISPQFRKEVKQVMLSILLFILVYVLLILASLALIALCFFLGYQIVINVRHFMGILGAVGLAGLGIMVFIFLIKFIFAVNRIDRSGSIEISEVEQPELFAFIKQVAADTQAPFPKKIYLSADVNASVSYDSSFWSMFFPVRKNLEIGLGLVNAVTLSEFKAVVAHEFGHFSQRSMKLGSYVYNVNRIIHNMLYNNTGFASVLERWANVSGIFAFFSALTARIAQGIQWILAQMYGMLNKEYSGLSRQMEFHADAVSASVSGSESLVTALRRLELANTGMQWSIQECNNLAAQKKRTANLYPLQAHCMSIIARDNMLPVRNNLPLVTDQFLQEQNLQRVNIKDQWASHPSTEDRVQALRSYQIVAEDSTNSPWSLFRNPEQLQQTLTRKMYGEIAEDNSFADFDLALFEKHLSDEMKRNGVPECFNEFYNGRAFSDFNDAELDAMMPEANQWEEVYAKSHRVTIKKLSALTTDIELLQEIVKAGSKVHSFDFDGQKYASDDAAAILESLHGEMKTMENEVKEADAKSIRFALYLNQQATGSVESMREGYRSYFSYRKELKTLVEDTEKMMALLEPIFGGMRLEHDDIKQMIYHLVSQHEPHFKNDIRKWMERGAWDNIDSEMREKLNNYLNAQYVYFDGTEFMDQELIALHQFAQLLVEKADTWVTIQFLELLKLQEASR